MCGAAEIGAAARGIGCGIFGPGTADARGTCVGAAGAGGGECCGLGCGTTVLGCGIGALSCGIGVGVLGCGLAAGRAR